ncbi:HD family hydrolase, diverged [Lachnospiraceae bacterium KM106-2]|nr:HD family hydrolase, diverged [Lachnospiraceae bacterium KM106-2]
MKTRLTDKEQQYIKEELKELMAAPESEIMKQCIQHGSVTTYDHVLNVTYMSYYLARKLRLSVDEISLLRGAYLHDFYLYDWHENGYIGRFHGLTHPKTAFENATQRYELNKIQKNIILSHMWPLTLRSIPRCKEAVIVCLADKYCAICESIRK